MRTRSFLAVAFIASAIGAARADTDLPRADWLSITQVAHRLQGMGYGPIAEIEADDGLWKAKAAKGGVLYKIKLDPLNGRVLERGTPSEEDD